MIRARALPPARHRWLPALAWALPLSLAAAQPVALNRASATLELEAAIPRQARHGLTTELRIKPELEFDLPAGMRLTAAGRARADLFDHLEPGQPDQVTIDPIARPQLLGDRTELELRELYLEATAGDLYLRLGKQQVVWGAADGLKVLDVVNPQSFREFILAEFEDSRIPLWTLDAETRIGATDLQFILIPEQTYHQTPGPDAPFAITAPRFAPPPPGLAAELRAPQRPDRPLADADAGLRLATLRGGWDLSLFYLYHFEDIPVPRLETGPAGPEVVPGYDRVHLVGGTFARSFGTLTLRGELGYTLGRAFALRGGDPDGVAESDAIGSVLGLDWNGVDDWLVSAQVFVDQVADPPGPLHRPRTDTTGTLLLRRLYLGDTLALELRWLVNANDGDGLLRPRLSYDLDDRITLWSGLDWFYGDRQGIFGQFDANDRAVFGVRYHF
ncbi:MAG: DUF1302 family protein [Pseudomonadota bacterium]